MKNWRIEYKILFIIGIIFLVIVLIALFSNNYFQKWNNNFKKNNLKNCQTTEHQGSVSYIEYTCNIKDETGKNYTISYPEINIDNKDIKKITIIIGENETGGFLRLVYTL